MPVVAIIGAIAAVAGAGTTIAGMVMKGDAANKAQGAAQGIADAQRTQAIAERNAAVQQAAPTAQEIQQIGDRIQTQSRYQALQDSAIQRDTQVLNNLDPALVTAGQQANELMQGKQAAILAPMKMQQDFQQKQMEQQLAAQLGPGYKTSSVGQQAIQQFQMQSNMQLQQAQMQSFQQVSQFLGYGISARTQIQNEERQGFQTGSEMSSGTLSAMGNIQNRGLAALTGTSQGMMGSAGNQFAGQAAQAKALSGAGDSAISIGGSLMGAGIGGLAKLGGGGTPAAPEGGSSFEDLHSGAAMQRAMNA